MKQEQGRPLLTVVIGANGSGKTTWTRRGREFLPKPFYNADSIAEGLGDPDNPELQRQARRIVDEAIENDLASRHSFGFESTYSGQSRPRIVVRAKELGYFTHAVFLGTDRPTINIARVRRRVEEGGHNIPEDEIVRRWHASWTNLLDTWNSFEKITLVDNSASAARVVLDKDGVDVRIADSLPRWAEASAPQALPRTPLPDQEE